MLNKVLNYFKTKSIGFYLTIVCIAFLAVELISYLGVPKDLYNLSAVIAMAICLAASIVLLFFDVTVELSPIATLIGAFLSLLYISKAEGAIDYLSTQFFEGISLQVIFKLPVSVILTVASLLVVVILSSVTMYMKKIKEKGE